MEAVIGIYKDKLFYEQNAEGKYDIMIVHNAKKYRTGFVFDSIKLFNAHQFCVSQTDSEGNTKYGVIAVFHNVICLPCCFDKIKPYQSEVLIAFIGEDTFYINFKGEVFANQAWKIKNS